MKLNEVCDICGAQLVPVRHAIVKWVAPAFGTYDHVFRCVDIEGCKGRVAASGDQWPVVDPVEPGTRLTTADLIREIRQ